LGKVICNFCLEKIPFNSIWSNNKTSTSKYKPSLSRIKTSS
jgi:hypothetical protein